MSVAHELLTNGHPSKRRKLSHGSVDQPDHRNDVEPDSDASSEDQMEVVDGTSFNTRETASVPQTRQHASDVLSAAMSDGSSTFAAQFNELIADQTPNHDARLTRMQPVLHHLESLINSIPETKPMGITEAVLLFQKAGVACPFPPPGISKDSNLKFAFKPPGSLLRTGCLPHGIAVKGDRSIRLVVEMPTSLLQEKDYLNLRAFQKRAFYLSSIAAAVKNDASHNFKLRYILEDGLYLLPALEITGITSEADQKTQRDHSITVTVSFPSDAFPLEKTLPARNCVRTKSDKAEEAQEPTPFYNSCLRVQSSLQAYEELISEAKLNSPAFADACRAGQLWLGQRGFSSDISAGGFGAWEWAIVCGLLLQTGGHKGQPLFSGRYSSLQLFKAMLQVFASKDLTHPWCVHGVASVPPSETPVLLDVGTGVNVLFKMTAWSYQSLRREASQTLVAINSKQEDYFNAIFITRVSEVTTKYDEVYALSIAQSSPVQAYAQGALLQKIYKIIKRGLGDRVSLISLQIRSSKSWAVEKKLRTSKEQNIDLALLLNPDTASRLIDHGPSAEEQDAGADFRMFWGDKAELRRFKDGSINESLVWSADKSVIQQILSHVLQRHFSVEAAAIASRSLNFATQLSQAQAETQAMEAFKMVNEQFQKLSSTLHQLDDLPLPIRSVNPVDTALRSSSTVPPLLSLYSDAIAILVQFDSSTRWPDSLPAIQYTKIAFLAKLADLLSASDSAITARIGLENTSTASTGYFNTSFLDISYPSRLPSFAPLTFRLRIHHDRELHLIQSDLANKSLHGSTLDTLASALIAQKRTTAETLHTNAIRALCTRFPPLSQTIRLLKKWTTSHFLLRHTPEQILETIAAHIFLHPYPWSTPGSSTTAFLRCLHFLSHWDWAYEPLLIDMSPSQDTITRQQRDDMKVAFQAWRKLDPNMNQVTWFVGTNLDPTGVVWTQGANPPKVVASRITALAGAAMEVVREKGLDLTPEECDELFRSPLEQYDFLLYVKNGVVRRQPGRSGAESAGVDGRKQKFKNLELSVLQTPVEEVGFDPVELYVQDLERVFGHVAMFFCDGEGGRVVAGLWRPGVKERKEWRVRIGCSTVLLPKTGADEEKVECEANLKGMLTEMEMMGEGIVRKTEILR